MTVVLGLIKVLLCSWTKQIFNEIPLFFGDALGWSGTTLALAYGDRKTKHRCFNEAEQCSIGPVIADCSP